MRNLPAGWDFPIGSPHGGVTAGRRIFEDPISAVAGGVSLIGGLVGADAKRSASNKAADAQTRAAQAGVDEQRRQFDALQKLLAPFVQGGTAALGGQMDLLGLGGANKQAAAIQALENSPQFAALTQQGEDSILANASATGGLRGGNVQAALAQFRPSLLSQLIDQQYSRLGGLTSLGQNAAAGTGNAGMSMANSVSQLLSQQGQAQAGKYLGQGQANLDMLSSFGGAFGKFMGGKF